MRKNCPETAISPLDKDEVGKGKDLGMEEVKSEAEEEFGVRTPRKMLDQHNLTHLPFRNWCAHCVEGKGTVTSHFKQYREDGLPEVRLDYCFLSIKNSPLATVLVAKEKTTKIVMSTVVPMKGAFVELPVRRVLAFLKG